MECPDAPTRMWNLYLATLQFKIIKYFIPQKATTNNRESTTRTHPPETPNAQASLRYAETGRNQTRSSPRATLRGIEEEDEEQVRAIFSTNQSPRRRVAYYCGAARTGDTMSYISAVSNL